MAEYSKFIITGLGQALMAKMISGTGDIQFTRVCSSDKEYSENELLSLSELTKIKQSVLISKVTRTNEVAIKIETAFSNTELKNGYFMRTLGVYAKDPDLGEILYGVTIEKSGNCYMPAYNGLTVTGAYIQLVMTVGNAENVSLDVDPGAFATIHDLELVKIEIETLYSGINETENALLDETTIEAAFFSVFGNLPDMGKDYTALSKGEIESALSVAWDGSSSEDVTALQKEDIISAVNTPWDGSSSKDLTALQKSEIETVTII